MARSILCVPEFKANLIDHYEVSGHGSRVQYIDSCDGSLSSVRSNQQLTIAMLYGIIQFIVMVGLRHRCVGVRVGFSTK